MGRSRFDGLSEYRWPLLCCVWCHDSSPAFCRAREHDRQSSPAPNPGDVAAKATAKIDRSLIQGLLRGSSPKLELVTVAVAAMATVATDRHVHRERAPMARPGLVQRTAVTDQGFGVSFEHEDGDTGGGRGRCCEVSAYKHVAWHATKCAESGPARYVSWPSLAQTGRPGVQAQWAGRGGRDHRQVHSPRTVAGHDRMA